MPTNDHNAKGQALYLSVAKQIDKMIRLGGYHSGERLPSIRELSRRLRVGVNTVAQAYAYLEDARVVEARPQSGYFVSRSLSISKSRSTNAKTKNSLTASYVVWKDTQLQVMRHIADASLVPLGRGAPASEMMPTDKLNRMLASQCHYFPLDCVSYAASAGVERLRTQIAKRSLDFGCTLSPDQIVITSGCIEAVTLALHATCRAGDTVVVESPVYYTFLNAIQWMGLKVMEVPSSREEGVDYDLLQYAIQHNGVRACILISNFNNPLGGLMPDEKKQALVRLLAKHGVPLIEDDTYGELGFARKRPSTFKSFDEKGLVLYCSSFSKTLAPGYRVGWIVPGRFYEKVLGLKTLFNLATATPTQMAIAEFLAHGGYDRHLRSLRRAYRNQVSRIADCVAYCFPQGTCITHPEGGYFLWIEMPAEYDAFRLYEKALGEGISIAPGTLFTMSEKFRNYLRLNCSLWSSQIEKAIEIVGRLAETTKIDG